MSKSNFEFLKGVNDFLFAIARAAEKNYPDDPNTTLVKLRQFGEATAKHLAKLLDIEEALAKAAKKAEAAKKRAAKKAAENS
ncbi:hypothetical protein A6E01_07895 [Vibrio breoganii]|uniref:Uncharacterized protein n=1 Tax=Vibrio breoganii TaxID=553239 RepID=A0AAN0XUZ8_9VIBR|nr:hypothetical protein [Vibrio breoganii]ANO33135.1 hypothetical protein A6E01_07895 [Vibrio breoganii]